MSISFGLSNFKGFKELESVELKPLTVICGTNNSGKSSLIQSLLLMKQSNVENTKIPLNTYIQEPLIFNGLYTRLGSFLDVVHAHSQDEEIVFRWKVQEEEQDIDPEEYDLYDVNSELIIKIKNVETKKKEKQTAVTYFAFQEVTTNFYLELCRMNNEKYQITIKNEYADSIFYDWVQSFLKFPARSKFNNLLNKVFFSDESLDEWTIKEVIFKDVQVKFDGIFPVEIIVENSRQQSLDLIDRVKKNLPSNAEEEALKYLYDLIDIAHNDFLENTNQTINKYENDEPLLLDYNPLYKAMVLFIRKFWSYFRYIGPIREAPKRFYLFDEIRRIDIGVNGEYTALVLALEQENIIPKYYRCIYDRKRISSYELREQDTLIASVNWWLNDCMKLPQIHSVDGLRGVINQVKLDSSGIEVDLPDVGFGVSQILPIIIECLRIGEGETIILEQPEIHLHPSLQSKLADFFLCMVKSGKRIVVETHSEHLINRLCLRIAQDESNEIKDLINVLFVSLDEQNQTSISQPIRINQYGEIENWPVGFFDEDDSRELLAATLKKRRSSVKP